MTPAPFDEARAQALAEHETFDRQARLAIVRAIKAWDAEQRALHHECEVADADIDRLRDETYALTEALAREKARGDALEHKPGADTIMALQRVVTDADRERDAANAEVARLLADVEKAFAEARKRVAPLVALERESENIGSDMMQMRLRDRLSGYASSIEHLTAAHAKLKSGIARALGVPADSDLVQAAHFRAGQVLNYHEKVEQLTAALTKEKARGDDEAEAYIARLRRDAESLRECQQTAANSMGVPFVDDVRLVTEVDRLSKEVDKWYSRATYAQKELTTLRNAVAAYKPAAYALQNLQGTTHNERWELERKADYLRNQLFDALASCPVKDEK